jgi:hypothetical protein
MIKKYVKKPVTIEALQWMGENLNEVRDFVGEHLQFKYRSGVPRIYIKTLEGDLFAAVGDYIIKGVNGEFYPCKPDIFEQTYEEV